LEGLLAYAAQARGWVLGTSEISNLLECQDLLETNSDRSCLEHVFSLDPETSMPHCKDFLETLSLESLEEQRLLLQTEGEVYLTIQGLLKLKGFETFHRHILGGLSPEVLCELKTFLTERFEALRTSIISFFPAYLLCGGWRIGVCSFLNQQVWEGCTR
jgi:hypothetical protein